MAALKLSAGNLSLNRVEVQLPWSKSHVNRLLLIDALSQRNPNRLAQCCDSRDSVELLQALQSREPTVNSGEGATPLRFLIAYRAAMNLPGRIHVNGTMQQRKVGSLINALADLGAGISTNEGLAPVDITHGITGFGQVSVDARRSSQAVSALMLIAPLFPGTKTISTPGGRISESYIALTAACLEHEGIAVECTPDCIRVLPGNFQPDAPATAPERDWSSAAFFLTLAVAMPGKTFFFPGLQLPSLQGDARALSCWKPFGLWYTQESKGISCCCDPDAVESLPDSMDFSEVPDLVPAWIMAAAMAVKTRIRLTGTAHLSEKESNRMLRMSEGLAAWNVALLEESGAWILDTTQCRIQPLNIRTGSDHRIAMAFATAAALTNVQLDDGHCVAKSFPGFFNELERCNLMVEEKSESHGN